MIINVPPLTPEQESQIPTNLIQEIRNRNVHLLVGSGLSIPLGYPSWADLILKIYERIQNQIWKSDSKDRQWLKKNCSALPDWAAELLKSTPGNYYYEALSAIFKETSPKPSSIPHALISLLPFKSFITTNFDTLLEEYLKIFLLDLPKIFDHNEILLTPKKNIGNEIAVYKIHGCASKDLNSIILSSTDYYKLLHDQRYIRFLDDLFAKNIILTIGFSLRDRNFRFFVEERYNLYRKNCAPMFAVVGKNETCPMEIELYRNKYNIQLIPISESQDFIELSSLLLSLYCLVYRVDSSNFGHDILEIVSWRLSLSTHKMNTTNTSKHPHIRDAQEYMSVFQEPVDFDLFTTLTVDANLSLSPGHLKAIFHSTEDKLFIKQAQKPPREKITFVANWLSNYFEAIPLGTSSRYLSIFHKRFLKNFEMTISYLLSQKEGWEQLIGDDDKSLLKLRMFNEFYRQEGNWVEWLKISENAELFLNKKSHHFLELMKTKMWVYFWTRRFKDAKQLLKKHPKIDEESGQYSYAYRLKFMSSRSLPELIKLLESKHNLEFFNRSLLGRSYARIAIKEKNLQRKTSYFIKAKTQLQGALKGAKKEKNTIEVSVQSWYLAIVYCELNNMRQANKLLSEVRRLDESIMDRRPGKAWLKLADYRLAKNSKISESDLEQIRDKAISAMKDLGIINVENYIEEEYLY